MIWTPRFMIVFFLLLVIGLSGASILTRGWLNAYYQAGWVLLAYSVVNLGSWICLTLWARSAWVRLGACFGCLWAIMIGLTFVVSVSPIDPHAILLTHALATASSAQLGSFICLSIARTPLRRWDRIFFFFAPLVGAIFAIVLFFLTPGEMRSLALLEAYIATGELWLCTAVWWVRLSCWRTQPGPAFLLGIAPIIQLTLMQPVNSNSESVVFFSQVMLLSLLLGALRLLQCELSH